MKKKKDEKWLRERNRNRIKQSKSVLPFVFCRGIKTPRDGIFFYFCWNFSRPKGNVLILYLFSEIGFFVIDARRMKNGPTGLFLVFFYYKFVFCVDFITWNEGHWNNTGFFLSLCETNFFFAILYFCVYSGILCLFNFFFVL